MPEPIAQWWARRQASRGAAVPYPVGRYRESWRSYPMLVRQYHPEFNAGIVLSQIPPAADVYLCWQCDVGHLFVATPTEQRSRPGRERRRSSWCPECLEAARPRTPVMPLREGPLSGTSASPLARLVGAPPPLPGAPTPGHPAGQVAPADRGSSAPSAPSAPPAPSAPSAPPAPPAPPATRRRRGGATGEPSVASGESRSAGAAARSASPAPRSVARRPRATRPAVVCPKTPVLPSGDPFSSVCAPPPASAVEGDLRAELAERLEFTPGLNAIRLARPFFDHLEAWPDVILPELRVAIEYDSTGRFGLEHVGRREEADRRKDRALRGAGWEVIRIRTGHLPALGPHDLRVAGLSQKTLSALVDELRVVRGPLIVDCYLRA
ncbi:hypothetical protein GCM10025867_26960 [Frondihabitans sucicola]|uniref:Zinc-ribbon domain-containing protein n=1 Tax=Frondihabitans sucicola TaxID=1268041 RepID=A0ABN6XZK8_9MICO|nr:hypothetical protein [Frondihabitans sucicola]BDZ50455.1 hypothetical protein GCM10025867_26960 [Frondihabitans sucicola]